KGRGGPNPARSLPFPSGRQIRHHHEPAPDGVHLRAAAEPGARRGQRREVGRDQQECIRRSGGFAAGESERHLHGYPLAAMTARPTFRAAAGSGGPPIRAASPQNTPSGTHAAAFSRRTRTAITTAPASVATTTC